MRETREQEQAETITPDDGVHSSREWAWIDAMAQAGNGEVRFGITEDGDTGIFWDGWCAGEWTLGAGDTAEDAVRSAMRRHPDPQAWAVVDDQTRALWQAWREQHTRSIPDADGGL